MSIKFHYYPGCSGQGTSIEYDMSTRALCRVLGIDLVDIPDWTCCGSTPAHTIDSGLSAALSARNLHQAQKDGGTKVTTPCPSCLGNLRTAEHKITGSDKFKDRVNGLLDEPYEGGVDARSILQVLFEDYGCDALKKKIVQPLKGLRVVPYYGCLTTRPTGIMDFDDPENPTSMDKLLECAGADVPEFAFKTECCGASLSLPRNKSVTRLGGRILEMAESLAVDAVVVACPLCHLNLDLRRPQINMANRPGYRLPVIYLTQLLGLAVGLTEAQVGMEKLYVNPRSALNKIGQEPAAQDKE